MLFLHFHPGSHLDQLYIANYIKQGTSYAHINWCTLKHPTLNRKMCFYEENFEALQQLKEGLILWDLPFLKWNEQRLNHIDSLNFFLGISQCYDNHSQNMWSRWKIIRLRKKSKNFLGTQQDPFVLFSLTNGETFIWAWIVLTGPLEKIKWTNQYNRVVFMKTNLRWNGDLKYIERPYFCPPKHSCRRGHYHQLQKAISTSKPLLHLYPKLLANPIYFPCKENTQWIAQQIYSKKREQEIIAKPQKSMSK